jgi:hypothetical protein
MASILSLSMAQKPINPADPELNFPKLLNREISVGSREFDPLIRDPKSLGSVAPAQHGRRAYKALLGAAFRIRLAKRSPAVSASGSGSLR